MKKLLPSVLLSALALVGDVMATTYDVGPGQPLATLNAVPWAGLHPGDFVNIHVKPGGYHEKIQISASGSAAAHIVIRGIPDPVTGALPIIDGKDAIEDPSTDFSYAPFSQLGVIVVTPRQSTYVYGAYHVSFVDIESLDIRNATYTGDGSITYTDQFGVVRGYRTFACGIYIEWAHDLAVRGCEISNCGNGVYANSKFGAVKSSQRLLIEKNYFHDNSNPPTPDPASPNGAPLSNGFGEHHIYTESAGVTIQFNRFGKHRPGAHGTAIKDRSSGEIIRYNQFDMDGQSSVMALLDPQGGIDFIDQQADYLDSYVYGNIITIADYSGSMSVVQWGAFNGPGYLPDGRSSYGTLHRRTLFFYNNTLVNHHIGISLFFLPDASRMPSGPTFETVDCRNNIFFADTVVQSSIYNAMHFFAGGTTNSGGDMNLGNNWISPGWRKDAPTHAWTGALNGTANLLVGDSSGANDAHFVDMAARDYHVLTGSNVIDTAGALSPSVLPANDLTLEYVNPQSQKVRTMQSVAMDLGALESTGLATPPPPEGALQFSVGAFSKKENCGIATITVTRVGGSSGAVGVSYSTPLGGTATEGSDYTPVVGTLSWPTGDTSAKSFSVPVVNDTAIETSETVSLSLFAPTGGAILGNLSSAILTITDDDTPPSTLMYGLGNTSNALFLFKSGAPGTPLSFTIPSGLANGDSLRALAVQPATGKLFAIGIGRVLYVINPFTGVATAVGPAFPTALTSDTMDLTFDRGTGYLRLLTSSGQNLLINPTTGAVAAIDTALAFASGDGNAGTTPQLVGADFAVSNGAQTLYGIDATKDALVTVGSANGAPLDPSSGQLLTVGNLGFNTITQAALHIPTGASFGWASLTLQGAAGSGLYAINLSNGATIFMGAIRTAEQVRDFVLAPPRDAWRQARFGANAGNALIAGDAADPDGNGVSNLMEYALGAQAGVAANTFMPVIAYAGDSMSITFSRPITVTDLTYTVQVSSDLVNWVDGSTYGPAGDSVNTAATSQISRSVSNGFEVITVRDNVPTSSAARRFIRLAVMAP